jgi:hypothetical protein
MKKSQIALLITVIALGAAWINAQENHPNRSGAAPFHDEERDFGPPRHHGHRPPPPPVMVALDTNHDGKLEAQEIENAAQGLKELDANGDGQLTFEELRPPFHGGFPSPEDEEGSEHFCPEDFDR